MVYVCRGRNYPPLRVIPNVLQCCGLFVKIMLIILTLITL